MLRLSNDVILLILDLLPNRAFGRTIRTCRRVAALRHNHFALSARKCNLYRNYGAMITCTHAHCAEYVIRFAPARCVLSRHLVRIAAKNGDAHVLRTLRAKGTPIDLQEIALVGAGQIEVLKFLIQEMGLNKDHVAYNGYYILLLSQFDDDIFTLLFNLGVSVEHLVENIRIRIINYLVSRRKYALLKFILRKLKHVDLTLKMKSQIKMAQFSLQFQNDGQNLMRKLEKLYS